MTGPAQSRRLESRTGLPEDLVWLRAMHPRAAWAEAPRFRGAASSWLGHHARLRDMGGGLKAAVAAFREGPTDPAAFRGAFAPRLGWFLQTLQMHHHIEDQYCFPAFRSLDPRLAVGMDLLEADHGMIHHHLAATAEAGQALIEALAGCGDPASRAADAYAARADALLDLLLRHLHDEEDLVIPALLHFDVDIG